MSAYALAVDPAAVLLDLDGVLYVEDDPIAGAVEAVAALRGRGLALRFVTNTTSRPRRDILARLERLGMPVPEHELVTPARLAVEHCVAADRRRARLLVRLGRGAGREETGDRRCE